MPSSNACDELYEPMERVSLYINEYETAWLIGVPVLLIAPMWTDTGSICGWIRRTDLPRVMTMHEELFDADDAELT